jgi:DNA end-binding protein Ku
MDFRSSSKALFEAKLRGKKVAAEAPQPARGKVINIMDALKRSLAETEKHRPAAAALPKTARRQKQKAAG